MGTMTSMRVTWLVHSAVDEVLRVRSGKPPEKLSHYTSAEGLQGILADGGLFLSDTRFLNDASELAYGRDLLLDRLKSAAITGKDPRAQGVLQETERLLAGPASQWRQGSTRVFVGSFCESDDLLSQWRGYSLSVGGYALVIRVSMLTEAAAIVDPKTRASTKALVGLRRVLYEREEQVALLDEVIERAFAETKGDAHGSRLFDLALSLFYSSMSAVIPQIKDPAFREEREWRLVCCASSGFGFRIQGGSIVPYVLYQFSLPGTNETGSERPVEYVMVGPSDRAALNEVGCRELLAAHGLGDGTHLVRRSAVPLRR
jgi:hypothetical protein